MKPTASKSQESAPSIPLPNAKHEAFAQLVADGKFENEAYATVYSCKASTARREGSKLSTKPLVRARVDWLKAQNAAVKALTRERKREILSKIAEDQKEDARVRIQAIQEDNRMTGDAEENKQTHVFNFNLPTEKR